MVFFKEEEKKEVEKALNDIVQNEITFDLVVEKSELKKEDGNKKDKQIVLMFQEMNNMNKNIKFNIFDISNKKYKDVDYSPVVVFNNNKNSNMMFYGIPIGYQFATLLEVIKAIETNKTRNISKDMIKFIKNIDKKIDIKSFVLSECNHCPRVAIFLYMAAFLNKNISCSIFEVKDIPDVKDKYDVQGVPKTVLNDDYEFIGIQSEEKIKEIFEEVIGLDDE